MLTEKGSTIRICFPLSSLLCCGSPGWLLVASGGWRCVAARPAATLKTEDKTWSPQATCPPHDRRILRWVDASAPFLHSFGLATMVSVAQVEMV